MPSTRSSDRKNSIKRFSTKKLHEKFGGNKKLQYLCSRNSNDGSLAQLNRASDYGSEGCGFESRGSHLKIKELEKSNSF